MPASWAGPPLPCGDLAVSVVRGARGRRAGQAEPPGPAPGGLLSFPAGEAGASPHLEKPHVTAESTHRSESSGPGSNPASAGSRRHPPYCKRGPWSPGDCAWHAAHLLRGPLTRFRSDSAAAFSSANTTLLRLALFLDLRSLTSGRVLPGEMGSSCSAFGVLGAASSRSKLQGEGATVGTLVRGAVGPAGRGLADRAAASGRRETR